MDPTKRAELERLLAAATPGPWRYGHQRDEIFAGNRIVSGGDMRFGDVDFMIAARNALPELLAYCDDLEQRCAVAERVADGAADMVANDESPKMALLEAIDAYEVARAARKAGG